MSRSHRPPLSQYCRPLLALAALLAAAPASAEPARALRPASVSASSEVSPLWQGERLYRFSADQTLDGDLTTCWQEAGEGHGVGESLVFRFEEPVKITAIDVANGFQWRDNPDFGDLFGQNGRVARLEVSINGGPSHRSHWLGDYGGWQRLQIHRDGVTEIALTIQAVYPGAQWPDTAISEVRFWSGAPGGPPLAPDTEPAAIRPIDPGLFYGGWFSGVSGIEPTRSAPRWHYPYDGGAVPDELRPSIEDSPSSFGFSGWINGFFNIDSGMTYNDGRGSSGLGLNACAAAWLDAGGDREALFGALSGIPAYQPGQSGRPFKYINPKIVRWGHDNLLPPPDAPVLGSTFRVYYNELYRDLFREMVFAYLYVDRGSGWEREAAAYAYVMLKPSFHAPAYLRDRYPDPASSGRSPDPGLPTISDYRVPLSIGFWLRRDLDGSREALWAALGDMMEAYDTRWYNEMIAAGGWGHAACCGH